MVVTGPQSVGGFEDDQTAAGADEGGAGAQQLVQRVVAGSPVRGQALGEFVQRGEIGDPAGQTVLENGSGARGRAGTGPAGAGATVCAGAELLDRFQPLSAGEGRSWHPAFRPVRIRSIASQTPMSFCAAISASTCTRTSEAMSSIVPAGFVVSVRLRKLAKKCTLWALFAVDWAGSTGGCPRGEVPAERHSGRDGYVIGEGQGQLGSPRNLAAEPGRLNHGRPCPIPRVAEAAATRGTASARRRHPSPCFWLDRLSIDADAVQRSAPDGFPVSADLESCDAHGEVTHSEVIAHMV